MLLEKSILVEKINTAIRKKWCSKSPAVFGYPVITETGENNSTACKSANYIPFPYQKLAILIKQLEERIQSLEDQNDHLFNFINFLVENLPDLVINIVQSEGEADQLIKTDEEKTAPVPIQAGCDEEKNPAPCPTRREMDVLELLIRGCYAKEIANRLFISETTVITHKKNLKEKFHAKNTAELIANARMYLPKSH